MTKVYNWLEVLERVKTLLANGDCNPSFAALARYLNISKTTLIEGLAKVGIANINELLPLANAKETIEMEEDNNQIKLVHVSGEIITTEQLCERMKIDLNKWEIDTVKVKTSNGYRKDRTVDWHVIDGHVTKGDVNDTGKLLVVTLYHTSVTLKKKVEENRAKIAIQEMLEDATTHTPNYSPVKHRKSKEDHALVIGMPDIHFGRLTWHEESGEDYDIGIARNVVLSTLGELIELSKTFPIGKVILPLGNDFFNVNSAAETTFKGTKQQEDTRWAKTFRKGRQLAVEMIENLVSVAPVEVIIVKGNHDPERIFYMGDAITCWFHNHKNVKVDNSPIGRKYTIWGKTLLGFSHGSEEKINTLPMLMSFEVPQLWAESTHREFHVGDKHHKEDRTFTIKTETLENTGVVVRTLRSLAAPDVWTYDKGYVSERAAEALIYSPERGLVAQYTALANYDTIAQT